MTITCFIAGILIHSRCEGDILCARSCTAWTLQVYSLSWRKFPAVLSDCTPTPAQSRRNHRTLASLNPSLRKRPQQGGRVRVWHLLFNPLNKSDNHMLQFTQHLRFLLVKVTWFIASILLVGRKYSICMFGSHQVIYSQQEICCLFQVNVPPHMCSQPTDDCTRWVHLSRVDISEAGGRIVPISLRTY